MGVAEEAMIASVIEYGWRSLVVPCLENRETVLEYNRTLLARLKHGCSFLPRRQVRAQTLRSTQT